MKYIPIHLAYFGIYLLLFCGILPVCSAAVLNNPYPSKDRVANVYYDTFSERPSHLDPIRSYSSNEYVFLGQIYEPPLQYHFLKRPYQLIPLTTIAMPVVIYQDSEGNEVSADTAASEVSRVIYRITIQPNILYQPHPSLAVGVSGDYIYHNISLKELRNIHVLSDFKKNGTRVLTATDYVYQIKRMAHPQVHSPIAGLMSQYILGLSELSKQLQEAHRHSLGKPTSYIDLRQYDLAGAQVIDEFTFEITLQEKYPQFLYWLAMSFFAPMPWEADLFYSQLGMADRNISLDWYPIGTGPFLLSENNPNQRMILTKNPNFRGEFFPTEGVEGDKKLGALEDAGKQMPFIDQAIFILEKESIPAWQKFLQGYYDTSGIASDNFDQAIDFNTQGEANLTLTMQNQGIQLSTETTNSIFYTGFNMRDPIIGGDTERARKLRNAIAIAVDFEEFIAIFANGRGIVAHGPIPPNIFNNSLDTIEINPYVYDLVNGTAQRKPIDVAKQLMLDAGYRDGRDVETGEALVLYFDAVVSGAGSKAHFDWLRKQFDKIGITLVVRATDYNRFQEKMLEGSVQIYQWGWNADYPDPENFLFLLYGPNAKFGINGENASNYSNEEFDALFVQMKHMLNSPLRASMISRMVEIVRRDSPWLWGYYPVAFSLHHTWYKNAQPNLMANNTLKYRRIDPSMRAEQREQWNRPAWWFVTLTFTILCVFLSLIFFFYRRKERVTTL